MNRVRTALFASALAVLVVPGFGCSARSANVASPEAQAAAEDSEHSHDAESQVTTLTAALQLGVANAARPNTVGPREVGTASSTSQAWAPTPEQATVATSSAFFRPAGCVTTTRDVATHTLVHTLSGCIGPWGLAGIRGVVTVTYGTTTVNGAKALELHSTAANLSVGHAQVTFDATATLIADGAQREMTWAGTTSGKTSGGRPFSKSATWRLGWVVGQPCVSLDGESHGDVAGRSVDTTVVGYRRCARSCPEQGGKITFRSPNGATSSIEYLGGPSAVVTSSDGTESTVTLACGLP